MKYIIISERNFPLFSQFLIKVTPPIYPHFFLFIPNQILPIAVHIFQLDLTILLHSEELNYAYLARYVHVFKHETIGLLGYGLFQIWFSLKN